MIHDFKDELIIKRHSDNFGKPSFLPYYDFCLSTTDLADNTVEIKDYGYEEPLHEVIKQICDFGGSEATIKSNIHIFITNDEIELTDKYYI